MAPRWALLAFVAVCHADWLPVFLGLQPKIDRNGSHPDVEAPLRPGNTPDESESSRSETPPESGSTSYFTSEWGRWSLSCLFQWERGVFSTPELPGALGEDGGWLLYLLDKTGVMLFGRYWPSIASSFIGMVGLVCLCLLHRARMVVSRDEKHALLLLWQSGYRHQRSTWRRVPPLRRESRMFSNLVFRSATFSCKMGVPGRFNLL